MTRLQKLQQRKAAIVAEMRKLTETAEADGERAFTEDENRSFDGHQSELDVLDKEIAREEKLAEAERSLPSAPDVNTRAEEQSRQTRTTIPATARRHSKLQAFRGEDADVRAYESGRFLQAVLSSDEDSRSAAREFCRDRGIEFRTMATTGDAGGGVFVPAPMENAIIDLREEYGVARQFADVMPMTSDTLTVPRRVSGVTAYFVAEGNEITASDAAYNVVNLASRKLAALTKITSELSEDAIISVADKVAEEMAYAFAVKEDGCLFNGDATSAYGGVTGLKNALAAGSKYTAITGNTAFSTLDLEDFEAMIAKLPSYPGIQPAWYIHKAGWAQSMLRLQMAAGGTTAGDIANGGNMTFMGYPVRFVNAMNSTLSTQTSTTGLVYFGDLRMAAMMGSRRGVSIKADASRYFEFDLTAVLATERFDVVVHGTGDASNAGPVIALVTPGS